MENHETKKLIGIVTDRDLALRVVGTNRDITNTSVGDVMTSNPMVCHPTDDLDSMLKLMSTHQVRRLPVIDEDNQVVGIIAQADVATRLEHQSKTALMLEKISLPD